MSFVKTMAALAGEVVDDGVALDSRAVEQVGGKALVLAAEDDLQLL
jgi:hypothetical protein